MGRSLVLPSTIHIRKSVACEWWNLCTDENWPHVTSSVLSSFFICTLYIAFFRYGGGVLGITEGVITPCGMYNDKVADEVSKRKKVHGHKYKLQDDDRLEKIVRKAIIKKIRIWHAMWCLIIYVWQVLSFSKCGYNSIFDLLGFCERQEKPESAIEPVCYSSGSPLIFAPFICPLQMATSKLTSLLY